MVCGFNGMYICENITIMDLQITPEISLEQIKTEFRKRFKNLDIAFFSEPHAPGEGSENVNRIPDQLSAGDAGDIRKKGTLTLNGLSVTADVEKGFREQFGLNAQILRKSGNVWLQSITSDHKTLAELNSMGHDAKTENAALPEEDAFREQE